MGHEVRDRVSPDMDEALGDCDVRADGGLVSRRRWAVELSSDDDGGEAECEAPETAEVARRGHQPEEDS